MCRCFFALAILNNVIPFSLIFLGQTALGAGLASVLNATTPFWTIVIANAVTSDEKLSWNKVAGVLFGIAGTAVMIGPGVDRRARRTGLGEIRAGRRVGLLCAGPDGRAPLQGRAAGDRRHRPAHRLDDRHDPGRLAGQRHGRAVLGEPACVGGGVRAWRCCRRPSPICSISPSSRAAGATNASLVTLIVPVSAILLGALFLGERLELFDFAGMALIAVGLVTIDGRPAAEAAGDRRLIATAVSSAKFFSQAAARDFSLRNQAEGEMACRFSHNHVALQHSFRLPEPESSLNSLPSL